MAVLQFTRRSTATLIPRIAQLAQADGSLNWMPDSFTVDEEGCYVASEEDWDGLEAHFARYGFRIVRNSSLASYQAGLDYISKLLTKINYLRDYPSHYRTFTDDWTKVEHEYLSAVFKGDVERALLLAKQTRFLREIHEKMRTSGGCALNAT